MNNYKQIQAPFKSEPSTVLILEDQKTNEKFYCFAVHTILKQFFQDELKILSENKQIANIRKFVKEIKEKESVTLYFFKYINGQTMFQMIENKKINEESFSQETITKYFLQLIETLYQLHSIKILGRVFTVENIIIENENENIILMDFGYGADFLNLRKNMINPPEILQGKYSIQLDVWLLGAVLYHLTKLRAINLSDSLFSSCISKRYSEEFTGLIQQMLQQDEGKRITFQQIIEHKFCQKNMDKQMAEKYLKFYTNLQKNWFDDSVRTREQVNLLNNTDFLLQTADALDKQHSLINQFYLNNRDLPQVSVVNNVSQNSPDSSKCQLETQELILESKIISQEQQQNSTLMNNYYFNQQIQYYNPEKKVFINTIQDQISKRIHMYFYKIYLIQSFGEEQKLPEFFDKSLYNFLFNKLRYLLLLEFSITLKGQTSLSSDPFFQTQEWLHYVKFGDRAAIFTIIERMRTQILEDSELSRKSLTNKIYQKYQLILPLIEKECQIQSNADERSSVGYLRQVLRPFTKQMYINIVELQKKTKNITYSYLACIVTFIHSINRTCEIDFLETLQNNLGLNQALHDFTDAENFHQYLVNKDRNENDYGYIIQKIHQALFE